MNKKIEEYEAQTKESVIKSWSIKVLRQSIQLFSVKFSSYENFIDAGALLTLLTLYWLQDYNKTSDKFDADIRDVGKKVQKFETRMEETMEKLQGSSSKMEEAEKEFKDKDDDVNNQARRLMLLEDECTINVEKLATTVLKLAVMSKDADNIVKGCRHWESKTMNNEMEIEELDKNMREAKRIGKQILIAVW